MRTKSAVSARVAAGILFSALALLSVVGPSAARGPGQAPVARPSNVAASCQTATLGHAQRYALRRTDLAPLPASAVTPNIPISGYYPSDIQSAYNLPSMTAGAGMTVAIVDAYDLPSAEADLATYRSQFGLPACTASSGCFTKVNQNGLAGPLPIYNTGWSQEIALDIDMVSAACPLCKILLVEANDNSFANLLTAVDTAVTMGAKFISLSWGAQEQLALNEPSLNAHFNHPGVAITVSTADCGYYCSGNVTNPSWPAVDPSVVAVGGTNLLHDASPRGWVESAWGHGPGTDNGAGSGCSIYITAKPVWQTDSGCANRTISDVSAVADPNTGVAVNWLGAWLVFGGTSASAPIIAGVYALAGTPPAGSQPASFPYAATSQLYDVTTGNNIAHTGVPPCTNYLCNGVPGYDGPTGLGTPNGVQAFHAPYAPDGSGINASPTTAVSAHQTGRTIIFTYTAASGGMSNGTVSMQVPAGWSPPSTTGTSPGFVRSSMGSITVSGQFFQVNGVTRAAGQTLTMVYGSPALGGPGATATSSVGPATWTTRERSTAAGVMTILAASPAINVAAADGAGTISAVTTAVSSHATARTMIFNYTAPVGGIVDGTLQMQVPAGWSAPSLSLASPGYVVASLGTVTVAGQLITISHVNRTAGQIVTLVYGSKAGGGPGATAPTPPGVQSWLTKERSTAAGVLTNLALSPSITVAAADGSGTITTPTTSVPRNSTGRTVIFTYTAPAGGTVDGTIQITVPTGWSAPSISGVAPGYVRPSLGTATVSGQVITISHVTRAAGQTLVIVYGSPALGGPKATAPSTAGVQSWLTKMRATAGGVLTNLASSPSITIT